MKSFVTHTTARLTAYRFGYTGHEKEGDLAEGVYTTQYRLLDMRLGHWMSVDPLFGKYMKQKQLSLKESSLHLKK